MALKRENLIFIIYDPLEDICFEKYVLSPLTKENLPRLLQMYIYGIEYF